MKDLRHSWRDRLVEEAPQNGGRTLTSTAPRGCPPTRSAASAGRRLLARWHPRRRDGRDLGRRAEPEEGDISGTATPDEAPGPGPVVDPLSSATDATLAVRARDGDVHAFEVVARRHGPLMRVYAGRLLGTDLESDDVVQDAFLTAWRRLSDLEDPSRLRPWLMRIVSNKSIDRLRVRRDHDDIDAHDAPASREAAPDRVVESRLQLDAMWTALDKLPLDQRRCWLLRETGGWSYAEIAEALQLPLSTVRGQIARARKFLLHEMEAWR